MRLVNALRSITFAALIGSAGATADGFDGVADDLDSALEQTPYWVARASYTAELNLNSGLLTLLPVQGEDLSIETQAGLSTDSNCRLPSEIDEGVYLVIRDSNGKLSLQPSYSVGASTQFDRGARDLVACSQARAPFAIALPSYALEALEAYEVGAVLLHR